MDWQKTAEQQALLLEELTALYRETLQELSQYTNVEAEEKRLNDLTKEESL